MILLMSLDDLFCKTLDKDMAPTIPYFWGCWGQILFIGRVLRRRLRVARPPG